MSDEKDSCSFKYSPSTTNNSCPAIWDEIYCWPPTAAGEVVSIPCIEILAAAFAESVKLYESALAYRKCSNDSGWDWNSWTNYSECLAVLSQIEASNGDDERIPVVSELIGHVVLILSFLSFFSLIVAIAIFSSLRAITCMRVRVHKNLCIALLLHCLILIVISSQVVLHPHTSTTSPLYVQYEELCKLMKTLGIYSSMATINWMFIEGLVLHKSLYSFGNKKLPFVVYHLIGWLLPTLFVGTWILLQELLPGAAGKDKQCWQGYGKSYFIWIVTGPMIFALFVNICFLINIIRILVIKLRNSHDEATPRAIRATAFLIPLLGLEHLIFCINPTSLDPRLESAYVIVNGIIQSIQGLAVAVLYCFANEEVRRGLKASWTRRRLSSMSSSGRSRLYISTTSTIMPSSISTQVTPLDPNVTRSLLPNNSCLGRLNSI